MQIGVTMFATDYAIAPHELAVEAEKRGFESVALAALAACRRRSTAA